jgi:hypothetical protein
MTLISPPQLEPFLGKQESFITESETAPKRLRFGSIPSCIRLFEMPAKGLVMRSTTHR